MAGAASGIAVLLAFCIFFMMPLRTTEVFTVLVDKTTGEAHLRHHVTANGYYKGKKVVAVAGDCDRTFVAVGIISDSRTVMAVGIGQVRGDCDGRIKHRPGPRWRNVFRGAVREPFRASCLEACASRDQQKDGREDGRCGMSRPRLCWLAPSRLLG